jgi:hypothetical protein
MGNMNNYDPFAPACNAHRSWEKDEFGRWKYVGLSFVESEALMEWHGVRLSGDDIVYPPMRPVGEISEDYCARMRVLWQRHEKYRISLVDAATPKIKLARSWS